MSYHMKMKITTFYFKDKASQKYAEEMLAQVGLVNASKTWYENLKEGYVETYTVTLYVY